MQICASYIDTLGNVHISLADCPAISLVFVCIHNFNLYCTDIIKIFFGQDIFMLNMNEADGNLGKPSSRSPSLSLQEFQNISPPRIVDHYQDSGIALLQLSFEESKTTPTLSGREEHLHSWAGVKTGEFGDTLIKHLKCGKLRQQAEWPRQPPLEIEQEKSESEKYASNITSYPRWYRIVNHEKIMRRS